MSEIFVKDEFAKDPYYAKISELPFTSATNYSVEIYRRDSGNYGSYLKIDFTYTLFGARRKAKKLLKEYRRDHEKLRSWTID